MEQGPPYRLIVAFATVELVATLIEGRIVVCQASILLLCSPTQRWVLGLLVEQGWRGALKRVVYVKRRVSGGVKCGDDKAGKRQQ